MMTKTIWAKIICLVIAIVLFSGGEPGTLAGGQIGGADADAMLFGEIKKGVEGEKREIKELSTDVKINTDFVPIVRSVDGKSGDEVDDAIVILGGDKKDPPGDVGTLRPSHRLLDPAVSISGPAEGEMEVTGEDVGYQAKSVSHKKEYLAGQFDETDNQSNAGISSDSEEPTGLGVIVTVLDSKTGTRVRGATVTFDGQTQSAPDGMATFKRKSEVLDPQNRDTKVEISAKADNYISKSEHSTWGELAQKLDREKNQIYAQIFLDPEEEPAKLSLMVTLIDAKSGAQVPDAEVKVGREEKYAPGGVATFVRDHSMLYPGKSQNKTQVWAEAPGYDLDSASFTWGFLANRYDKEKNQIVIELPLNPREGGDKITKLEMHCDHPTIFEVEVSACVARIHLESGRVKDVSEKSSWTPAFVEETKGGVRGDKVKEAYALPHTVNIKVSYDATSEEGGQKWAASGAVLVKPGRPKPQPDILVAKTADPPNVSAGESVTYTFTVTNPGNCPLSDVTVTDDKCEQVSFVGGDLNKDYLLDTNETWTYECSVTLSQMGDFINAATAGATGPNGKLVSAGGATTVRVTRELVDVPDLYDLTREAAEYEVKDARLAVGMVAAEASDLAPGQVTRQTPEAGTKVPAGSEVHFWVSMVEPKLIRVDPSRATIERGDTIRFKATLVFEDGTEEDITRAVTWTPGPGNVYIGGETRIFTVSAEYIGGRGFAMVNVGEAKGPDWQPPVIHPEDTLARVPRLEPADYTWYALCVKGEGEVLYSEDTDPSKYHIMAGPFPAPRTVRKWIDDNCPRWRCSLDGTCADKPATGGEWNVFCDKESGAVTIGRGWAASGQKIMAGGFLGELDARFWVDRNCPMWRCTKDGACAQEPARGGEWRIFCDTQSGAVTVGTGTPRSGQVVMDEGFLEEPDARMWLDLHCPRWRCTRDGNCAEGPARGGDWYVFCADSREVRLGSGHPDRTRDRIMADDFFSESDARLWVNQNCPTWRCDFQNRCVLPSGREDEAETKTSIDDAIDDVMRSAQRGDCDVALTEFSAMALELDGVKAKFDDLASYFDQQLRSFDPLDPQAWQAVCSDADVAYALRSARTAADAYEVSYAALTGLFGDVAASCTSGPGFEMAQADYGRLGEQGDRLHRDYSRMLSDFGVYECDEQISRTNVGDRADDTRDPEDVDAGVEVCGDGIDNDGDGEIDECDAGCCDKNVQVTVSDCGPDADDMFLIAIDGNDLGVTPKGQANTFNVRLSPGDHSVTITCLDDGGDPPGSATGTACVWVTVYSETITGSEESIAYGSTATVSFTVPTQATVPAFPKVIDGSSLKHLEQGN